MQHGKHSFVKLRFQF